MQVSKTNCCKRGNDEVSDFDSALIWSQFDESKLVDEVILSLYLEFLEDVAVSHEEHCKEVNQKQDIKEQLDGL